MTEQNDVDRPEPAPEPGEETPFESRSGFGSLLGDIGKIITLITSVTGLFGLIMAIFSENAIPALVTVLIVIGILAFLSVRRQFITTQSLAIIVLTVAVIFTLGYFGYTSFCNQPINVSGVVLDPDRQPINGLNLNLRDSSGVDHRAQTASDGNFRIDNVPEGGFDLLAGEDFLFGGEVRSRCSNPLQEKVIFKQVVQPLPWTQTPAPTFTLTPSASPTHTITFTPSATMTVERTPTPTPVSPLLEIFPQSVGGEAFVFEGENGVIDQEYLEPLSCIHSGTYGLRLTYSNTEQSFSGWIVSWQDSPTGYFNAAMFTVLTLKVKGKVGDERFQLGLKDLSDQEHKIEIALAGSDWQSVTKSLSLFAEQGVNLSQLQNVSLGFNSSHGSGTICIDDFAFLTANE